MTNSTAAYQLAHPDDDEAPLVRSVSAVMIVIATLSMIGRVAARRMKGILKLTSEDYAMFIGWIFFMCFEAFLLNCLNKGLGRHTVFIPNLKEFTISLILVQVGYNVPIPFIKGSILILYSRLFVDRRLKIFSWVLWLFICGYSISVFFGDLFGCYPIAFNWDPTIKGRCISLSKLNLVGSIINIVTDFTILFIPLPFLWKLQMSPLRKFQLMGIFLLGGFVCFVSIYRATLISTVSHDDPAWSDVIPALWSSIELAIAILSGNLPVMRPIFNKIFNFNDATEPASFTTAEARSGKSGGKSSKGGSSLLSYPKLRPGNTTHETMISHGNFERLGPSVDEVSMENLEARKCRDTKIMVTQSIDQDIEMDRKPKSKKSFT